MPVANSFIFETPTANCPVVLESGDFTLSGAIDGVATTFTGPGKLSLNWDPTPRAKFELGVSIDQATQFQLMFMKPKATLPLLEIPSLQLKPEVMITSVNKDKIGGYVWGGLQPAKTDGLRRVVFHLVNYCKYRGECIEAPGYTEKKGVSWCGRVEHCAEPWRIVIDQTPNSDLFTELYHTHGYGITHVGVLERIDGGVFSSTDADGILDTFGVYLRFCRALRVAPFLKVGFDNGGNCIWRDLDDSKVLGRYIPQFNWFNQDDVRQNVSFQNFLPVYQQSPVWTESLRWVVEWYVEAHELPQNTDKGIVLTQIAFESLAWAVLLHGKNPMDEKDFKNLHAHGRIRTLIQQAGIDPQIPSVFPALIHHANQSTWKERDGPGAYTAVRNSLVHPVREATDEISYDVWRLAMWYLESVLLKLFGQGGKYRNRVSGKYEVPPWLMVPSAPVVAQVP